MIWDVLQREEKLIRGDGLIVIRPSPVAACRMEMYNADGSRGEMCGNGIRCVAKYAFDHARTAGLKRETAIHKSNIMKLGDVLFLNSTRTDSREYKDISYD